MKNEVLYDAQGEAIPMQMISVEERDFNFHKVWLQNLVQGIDEIANQKLRLAFWIIENLNKENQLIMTQRQIAETENAFVVKDGIEYGSGNILPLWAFGLLY